jgi:hypothetical protein
MLEKAIERYGGISHWNRISHIVLDIKSIDGLIPRLKGMGRRFPDFGRAHIFPHEQRVEFFDRNGQELGTYQAGAVTLKNQSPLPQYRLKFKGLTKYLPWNLADAIYFFGYSLTTYASIPFILKDFVTKEHTWEEGFKIEATFPEGFDTHCKTQSFYFNSKGLLVRHDYHAEILGCFAYGAHFTTNFKLVNDQPIAQNRKVYARIGNCVTPILVLQSNLEPLDVIFN